jgi:hemerythrin
MERWRPEMSVGVEEIDLQHQEIFRRAAEADEALGAGRSADETDALVEFLIGYCETHFAHEQRLMHRTRYPGLAEHVPQHAWFVREVRRAQQDLAAGAPDDEVALRLNELLLSWLVKHIGSHDRALAEWLRAHPQPA